MKKSIYLIVLLLILGLVLTGCLLSNVGQVPATEQSGIAYLTKNVSPPNLVGLWHFDEGVDTTANDSSAYENDGTIHGAIFVDGKFGNALSFNGTNDYVEIANDMSLNITQGTWEAWIKFDALPSFVGHPMNPLAKANQHWIHGSRNDPDSGTTDAIVVKIRVGGTRYCAKTSSSFITAGMWYYVAGTYDGETLKLYVNGILVDSNTTPSGNIDTGTQIMAVGTWSTLIDYFQGTIDEVRIWDGALTADDIAYNYSLGDVGIDIKPGSDPNSINLGSNGVVPVAILGSADFEAATVNPSTVTLAGADVKLKGKSGNAGSLEDVNDDGYLDLVVQVYTTSLVLTSGDAEAVLNAYTYAGPALTGSDWIRIVPPE